MVNNKYVKPIGLNDTSHHRHSVVHRWFQALVSMSQCMSCWSKRVAFFLYKNIGPRQRASNNRQKRPLHSVTFYFGAPAGSLHAPDCTFSTPAASSASSLDTSSPSHLVATSSVVILDDLIRLIATYSIIETLTKRIVDRVNFVLRYFFPCKPVFYKHFANNELIHKTVRKSIIRRDTLYFYREDCINTKVSTFPSQNNAVWRPSSSTHDTRWSDQTSRLLFLRLKRYNFLRTSISNSRYDLTSDPLTSWVLPRRLCAHDLDGRASLTDSLTMQFMIFAAIWRSTFLSRIINAASILKNNGFYWIFTKTSTIPTSRIINWWKLGTVKPTVGVFWLQLEAVGYFFDRVPTRGTSS